MYAVSDDIINMQILFSLFEKRAIKSKNPICYVIFLNKDISVTNLDITLKFSLRATHIHSEESMAQIFSFRP